MTKRNKNRYVVNGGRTLVLTNKGQEILVDTEDIDRLKEYTWCISGNGYAMSRSQGEAVIMHRFIMNASEGLCVDHINGGILDNRKQNLRVCAKQENEFNQKIRVDNTTGYRGVCPSKSGRFRAYIVKNGKQYRLGVFETAEAAAKAYNEKAVELYGDFARLNTLKTDPTTTPLCIRRNQ